MSLENKISEAIKGKKGEEKREAVLKAIEDFAEENIEEKRKQEFYNKREEARKENDEKINDIVQAMKEEFNTKWQEYEDNGMTIPEKEIKEEKKK